MSGQEKGGMLRSRLSFLGVLGAFVLPLALAIVMYARLDLWTPSTQVNHGRLLEPVHPLSMLALQGAQGEAITLDDLQGIWTLAYVASNECGIACQTDLFKIRQVRAMLGRDLVRVQSMYIALDRVAVDSIKSIGDQYPNLRVGLVAQGQEKAQASAFAENPAGDFFLLDPHGNLVLRYDENATSKGLLKDLTRLLKVSQIG